jgi:hypothetical protein
MIRIKWTLTKLYIGIELANDDIQLCVLYLLPCLYANNRLLVKEKPKQCLLYGHKNLKFNHRLNGNIMSCILVGIHGGQLTSYCHHYEKLTFSKAHYHRKFMMNGKDL